MSNCPNCGFEYVPGAAVCQRCGAALPPTRQVPPMPPPQPLQPQPPQYRPYQPYQPAVPPRVMLPPPQAPQFIRQQREFCWMDVFTVLGFVSSVVGYFFASVLLLPLGLIASIVGFRSDRNRGLAVAGIVISAIGLMIKVMLILDHAALLPDWFTNGIW